MFEIIGETIYFKGEPFAKLLDKVIPTVKGQACEELELMAEWNDLYEAHEEEIEEAYQRGYNEGYDERVG